MSNKLDKIFDKAKVTLSENDRVKNLLKEAKLKLDKVTSDSNERSTFINQIQILVRMVRAHFNREYTAFSASTILSVIFALVYFITPIDLIPDFIPALGLTDDISIVYFIFRSLTDDIVRFKAWEDAVS